MQKTLLAVCAFLFISFFTAAQTTYYVSSSGNDSNSGKSSTSSWKTLSKLNSITFKAGDRILFRKGDTWREQLNISYSGTSSSPIVFTSYGSGSDPVISGSTVLTGFTKYSGNVWRKSASSPQQVFFNGIRGTQKSSTSGLGSEREWAYSSSYLYIYSSTNPSGKIEVTTRRYGINISGDYITVDGFQVERVYSSAIQIASSAAGVIVNNCQFYQWSIGFNSEAGVRINGNYCEVKNSTFGKKTGNDIADQGWAGFSGIVINGKGNSVNGNKIYHNAIENESKNGAFAYGINVINASGTTKIFGNYIYHTGGNGISMITGTRVGDEIHVFDNKVEFTGQAGISAYQTRGQDGKGGKGYVYKNDVSYANRLGGDVGGNGTQASGIHFNDGLRPGTDSKKPYMKWYCYDNVVYNCRALKVPNSPDASGIIMDYNADNVEVYRNIVYDNYSTGIQIWNANNCKVTYNIIYGNDAGIAISALSNGVESANNNQVLNNTFYKNYNGNSKGTNINAEIFFGMNTKNNVFKNNILYSATEGFAYKYNVTNTSGHIVDNNIVYADKNIIAVCGRYNQQTFSQWKSNYPSWDRNSKNANPLFTSPASNDFSLTSNSPAINSGALLGYTTDFLQKSLSGKPDIGAMEYGSQSSPPPAEAPDPGNGTTITLNAMDGDLSGDAKLGSMTGMKNNRAVYFQGGSGAVKFSINIPKAGTWYAWARMYYLSSGQKNSFYITVNSIRHTLGDDDNKYNQWHWDGYKGARINLGQLQADQYYLAISPREPGLTLWVDQIILTDDPNYIPSDDKPSQPSGSGQALLLNALNGQLSGDARLGSMVGMKNNRAIYFQGGDGAVKFSIDIPRAGTWYAWARMYYLSSGQKNSFFITVNGIRHTLGDDDNKYNQWHWDGNKGARINLGQLKAAQYFLAITPREPGLTLWVDQIILTDDPNYNPNTALAKDNPEEENAQPAETKAVPDNFDISQNYPNPFNPSTSIKFSIPEVAQVTLKVYDILGSEVANLIDEVKAPGYYEISFDGSGLASGIYIYQLRTNNFVQSKKMNLLK
ncbi:MAG: right-handed parallel beta-helix repeat-containing protein [Ignavibacteriaceae bacterium]